MLKKCLYCDKDFTYRNHNWLVLDDGSNPSINDHPFDSDAAGFNNE